MSCPVKGDEKICGIVFAGGMLGPADLEIFNQMLYCDVFRGSHSTGVMSMRTTDKTAQIVKAAGPSAPFLDLAEYKDMSEGLTRYVIAPTWLVGHNRHATKGAINAQNAHPFQHGNITLVHNGTLTDQSLLPDHTRFQVDSENIAYAIDKIGAAQTIQLLDGAFTLIWHDNSDNTLHIIRNKERPFHLARCGADWFGASEEAMVMWLLGRSKQHKARISEHFECEVGVEYVFDVNGTTKKCQLKEQIKHELPTFTYASRYSTYSHYNAWAGSQTSPASSAASTGRDAAKKAARDHQNEVAKGKGIDVKIGQRIQMIPHTWFAYTSSAATMENKGRITGYNCGGQSGNVYYEVDAHGADKAMYDRCMDDAKLQLTGTVAAISLVKDVIRVVISGISVLDPVIAQPASSEPNTAMEFDDDIPFEQDSFYMPSGMKMTRAMWNQHDHSACGGCGQKIPWKDAPKADFAYQCFWHKQCLNETTNALFSQQQYAADDNDTFVCACCGKEKHMSLLDSVNSQDRNEDICGECGKAITERKRAIAAEKTAPKAITSICTVVDKTDGCKKTNVSFSLAHLDKMIRMRGSKKARTLSELQKAYIEKRSATIFAYYYNPETNHNPAGILLLENQGGKDAAPAASFSQPKPTGSAIPTQRPTTLSLRKILRNGQSELQVTKAYWNQIGQCCNCYSIIPWKDVEACALTVSNRIVCPTCRGE